MQQAVSIEPDGTHCEQCVEKVRQGAHAKLGDLMTQADAEAEFDGRKPPEKHLDGFFTTPDDANSFSFQVTRRMTPAGGDVEKSKCEVASISQIFVGGHVLEAMVVDRCEDASAAARARAITVRWLRAFNATNPPARQ